MGGGRRCLPERLRRHHADARLRVPPGQVQAAGRAGAPAVRHRHRLRRARSADQPWTETGDIGLQLGDLHTGVLTYAVGVFDGVVDQGNGDGDLNDSKESGRPRFLQPFTQGALKGLGFGVAATTGTEQGGLSGTTLSSGLPSYRSPGQQTVFRYRVDAAAPLNWGNRRRPAEPAGAPGGLRQRTVRSPARYALGAKSAVFLHRGAHPQGLAGERLVFLTGEKAGFRSPTPKKVFDPKEKGYGAVELVARYGELDIDDAAFPYFAAQFSSSISREKSAGVGLNWHLNKQIKVAVNYEHTTFDGGAAVGDRKSEDFFVTRFQHLFRTC